MKVSKWLTVVLCTGLIALSGCNAKGNKTKYFQSAKGFESKGRAAEAIIQYKNALQIDPGFVDARVGLARVLLSQGDTVGSEIELNKALQNDPHAVSALLALGQIHLLARHADLAEEKAESVLAIVPNNHDALLLLGQAKLISNQLDDAETNFRNLVETERLNVQGWIGLAAVQLRRGDPVKAEQHLREAVNVGERSPALLLILAAFLQQHQRFGESQEILAEVQARSPQNVPILISVADLFTHAGDITKAEATLLRARDLSQPDQPQRTILADYYVQLGEKQKAVEELHKLVAIDGPERVAAARLGELLIDQNELSEAHKLVDRIHAGNKKSALARYLSGRMKLVSGDSVGAMQDFHDASRYLPNSAQLWYYQGIAYSAANRNEQALNAFNQALQIDSNYGPARVERARLEMANHDIKAALADCAVASSNWPVAKTWAVYVDALVQNGETAAAEQLLETLIANAQADQEKNAFITRAALLDFSQRQYGRGRERLAQLQNQEPEATVADQLIGVSYAMQGRLDAAEHTLLQSRERHENDQQLRLLLADVYMKEGKLAAAKAEYDSVLQKDPTNNAAQIGMAEVALQQGRLSEAADDFERLGKEKSAAGLFVRAAQVRERTGETQLARRDYDEALRMDPQNVVALNNLSWIYLQSGDSIDLALTYAEQAKSIRPNSPEISDTLAWAYYLKKRYRLALSLLESAVTASPKHGLYQYHLAKCYLALDRTDNARASLERAMQLGGNFPREDAVRELHSLEIAQ